ncbi:MAG: hypothetical protein V4857_10960 [Pseudomonadota bacterium]
MYSLNSLNSLIGRRRDRCAPALLCAAPAAALACLCAAPAAAIALLCAAPAAARAAGPAPGAATSTVFDEAAGRAAGADLLGRLRGGDASIAVSAKLDGAVSANTAVNVTTGANVITNGSFANASGIPIVIQNTGANVLIQNATVLNLQLR